MSVDLEYSHKLATTLMWKRFGGEVPIIYKSIALKDFRDGEISHDYVVGSSLIEAQRDFRPDDLWLYLSDLDILRVKGEG